MIEHLKTGNYDYVIDLHSKFLSQYIGKKISKIAANYFPHAQDIARLGHAESLQSNFISAEQAVPVYLRNKVVLGAETAPLK